MTPRYCTICTKPITDPARLRRQSPYCSEECRRVAKLEKRETAAGQKCRLCGRRFRRRREVVSAAAIECEPVRPSHSEV